MKKRRVVTLILIVAIIALIATTYINTFQRKAETSFPKTETEIVVPVKGMRIVRNDFKKILTSGGEIYNSVHDYNLAAVVTGTVGNIAVKEGDTVTKGEPICEIDPSTPGNEYVVTHVTAPMAGIVSSVGVVDGGRITSGSTIIVISQIGDLQLKTSYPEKYYLTVKKGMEAYFYTEAQPDKAQTAILIGKDEQISPATRTFSVWFSLADTSDLASGMYVQMNLVLESSEGQLLVPNDLILTDNGKQYVYIYKDGSAVKTEVVLSDANEKDSIVVSGIGEGDMLLMDTGLADGEKVEVVE